MIRAVFNSACRYLLKASPEPSHKVILLSIVNKNVPDGWNLGAVMNTRLLYQQCVAESGVEPLRDIANNDFESQTIIRRP
jgi:hypothetical protein